jgi:fluoride exporter
VSPLVVLAVGCVGGVGAIARLVVDAAVSARVGRQFPYGTLVVNLTGAFLLGLLVGLTLDDNGYRIAGTGLIGAFTTFSTWSLESHRLAEDGELRDGVANFVLSLLLGVALAWVGRHLGATL